MSELFKNLVLQTISKECYEKYFLELDFFDGKLIDKKKRFSKVETNFLITFHRRLLQSVTKQSIRLCINSWLIRC